MLHHHLLFEAGKWHAEAVGGGVLIPDRQDQEEEEAEAQSFVVPVANGIQLETRRPGSRQAAHDDAQDVSITSTS